MTLQHRLHRQRSSTGLSICSSITTRVGSRSMSGIGAGGHVRLTTGARRVSIKGGHGAETADFYSDSLSLTDSQTQFVCSCCNKSLKYPSSSTLILSNSLEHKDWSPSTFFLISLSTHVSRYNSTITSHCYNVYSRLLPVLPVHIIPNQRTPEARLLLSTATTIRPHSGITTRSSRQHNNIRCAIL